MAVEGIPLERKSAIVVPLVADQRLLGVIRAVKIGVDAFTTEHYRFAQTLANQASLAISAAAAHEAVRRLSVTDELTGAYNGRHFRARLHEEIERARRGGRPLALLVIDSDSLKEVNDRFGHEAGNRHLVAIAQAVQSHVRTSDVVARFGGDEFLVLQPDATPEAAALVAERIRAPRRTRIRCSGAPTPRCTTRSGTARTASSSLPRPHSHGAGAAQRHRPLQFDR